MTPNILEIKKYPDKILRAKCSPVEAVDDDIRNIISDMIFTMRSSDGIGLAAPQVGIARQIIVVDAQGGPIGLINPKIITRRGKNAIEEGCLSLPDTLLKVRRSKAVQVQAVDENGKKVTINAEGLFAIAIQHEIDHINGVLIIDYANFFTKKILKHRLLKHKKIRAM